MAQTYIMCIGTVGQGLWRQTIGSSGNLQRTIDGGQRWQVLPLLVEPNSRISNRRWWPICRTVRLMGNPVRAAVIIPMTIVRINVTCMVIILCWMRSAIHTRPRARKPSALFVLVICTREETPHVA